jgi:tetratricopeptide (TPR) repeat protein
VDEDLKAYLEQKFPEMRPTNKAPGMMTFNGIGTSLYGSRDFDEETRSHVKTLCLTVVFLPVFMLGSYRVVNAENGGWYFLGKVPLSKLAKLWNLLFPLAIAAIIGIGVAVAHFNSEEYKLGKELEKFDEMASAGQSGEAARGYKKLMVAKPQKIANQARQNISKLIDAPTGGNDQAIEVFKVAMELHREKNSPIGDPFSKGAALAKSMAETDAKSAAILFELIAPYSTDKAILETRRDLLERVLKQDPKDIDSASRLAKVYRTLGQLPKCEALLTPFEAELGTRDGSAILGSILADKGQLDRAQKLLQPFVESRLPTLQNAFQTFDSLVKSEENRLLNLLRTGSAPGFDYQKHERLPKDQQGQMVDDFIDKELAANATLKESREAMLSGSEAIGAAMDLGMVRLQKGQSAKDPQIRKLELEAAEQTFLSVKSYAGRSGRIQISLGQVYHWMGRPADAKKQFDELLTQTNRDPDALLGVAQVQREVGNVTEARKLAEEAYEKATRPELKFEAAIVRGVMYVDIDDRILWLSRCNPDQPDTKASLLTAKGSKAQFGGDDAAAAELYRQSIEIQEKFPESSATLNNTALVMFALFQINRDKALFQKAIDKMDRAVALTPTNTILLNNASETILENAFRDIIGDAIDFSVLRTRANWQALTFLYADEAGKQQLAARVQAHPGVVKAKSFLDKLLLLSPNRPEVYDELGTYSAFVRDADAMKTLRDKAEKIDFDSSESKKKLLERLSGTSDEKYAAELKTALAVEEKTLAKARQKGGATFAMSVSTYVGARIGQALLAKTDIPADELLKLSEEAHAATPSSGTRSVLQMVLQLRLHAALAKASPEYKQFVEMTRRTIPTYAPLYGLSASPAFAALAVNNPDFPRLKELSLQDLKNWPKSPGLASWVTLKAAGHPEAATCARAIQSFQLRRDQDAIELRCTPWDLTKRIEEFWYLQLDGKPQEGITRLGNLKNDGVTIPVYGGK